MMHTIQMLFRKYEEIILYIIMGVAAMAVSLASYYILANPLGIHYQAANILSWICAVSFAYATNRKFVFKSKVTGVMEILKEAASFVSGRLASLAAEIVSMYFFVQICGIDDNIVKLINQVLVTILNYLISKFWVFRKSGK